ncbi:MAG TPA: cyclopropane-fatty-acyl-phospholipid synthase family protein [Bryobacteraceae bacterium]|nr:cyclopropane-fatty-acyl-phospholipid synthase family protein [Bryobacteraceae bacterium]
MLAPFSSSLERWMLWKILNATGPAPIRLTFRDSVEVSPPRTTPVGTIVIHNAKTLIKLILDPEIGMGDGYADGGIEVQGDLVNMAEAVYRTWPAIGGGTGRKFWSRCMEHLRANTPRRSRDNVHHHYDLRTDFYQHWLDPELVYTCAYFPTPSATLEEAQFAKMDLVCRKLQLQPGETVVEAGCGWGALALHMARYYGVRVKAFNLSHEQIVFARQRARQEGLNEHVEFIEDDYRNISGRFDAFVSIGMLEHVGLSQYAELGRVIHRSIGSSGRGLLHFIGRNYPVPLSTWIRKRIFPGAYPPALREAMTILEPWDYSVCDVENLRLHYAKTLEHWLARFEGSSEQLTDMFDDRFVRTWRIYLAGSLVAFRVGTMQLFQVTFTGSQYKRIPWTRAYLYQADRRQAQEQTWTNVMS